MDALLDEGLTCLTVLDVSAAALDRARVRLGSRGDGVRWMTEDVTSDWRCPPVDVWHDRAAFHFLVEPADRSRYVEALKRVLKPSGYAIIATFAEDGPSRCSGLPVVRHSVESLGAELGTDFSLVQSERHDHTTPGGTVQQFMFAVFHRTAAH